MSIVTGCYSDFTRDDSKIPLAFILLESLYQSIVTLEVNLSTMKHYVFSYS